jgi:hypothetical protein
LEKLLSRCRLTIITTAAPFQADKGDQGPGAPYNAAAKFYTVYSGDTAKDHDLRIAHVAIDRDHTTAADPAAYFPLSELRQRAARGDIGSVGERWPCPRQSELPRPGGERVGERGFRRLLCCSCWTRRAAVWTHNRPGPSPHPLPDGERE